MKKLIVLLALLAPCTAMAGVVANGPNNPHGVVTIAQGQKVDASNFDDLIRTRIAEHWVRPPSVIKGITVVMRIEILPDGTINNVHVSKSSSDAPFDNSVVAAVKSVQRLPEMQGLTPSESEPYRAFLMTFTPEDLYL